MNLALERPIQGMQLKMSSLVGTIIGQSLFGTFAEMFKLLLFQ